MSSLRFRTSVRGACLLGATLAALASSAPAAGAHVHTVAPGETLSSIAGASGMQIARLAAANGLAWDSQVIAGQNLQVPPADGAYTSTTGETMGYSTSSVPLPGSKRAIAEAAAGPAATPTASGSTGSGSGSGSSSPASGGSGAAVRPGETLSAIAARLGVSVSALAAANGLADPNFVMSGTTLRAPAPGTTAAPAPSSVPAATTTRVSSSTGPEGQAAVVGSGATATAERLSSSQISSIAAEHGVPGSLAAAIAWQESGNNNAMVSSAGARGVMQVMPGTWDWIDGTLATSPLNRASATDNVRAGSLFLKQLLAETGGDEATAIAGYYQGLGSVRERGLYDDTQQYVRNVQALRSRFGG